MSALRTARKPKLGYILATDSFGRSKSIFAIAVDTEAEGYTVLENLRLRSELKRIRYSKTLPRRVGKNDHLVIVTKRRAPAFYMAGGRTSRDAVRTRRALRDEIAARRRLTVIQDRPFAANEPPEDEDNEDSAAEGGTYVVYRGPSMINGRPIVGVLTGLKRPSSNSKTGPMIQLWIMPANVPPHVAQRTGDDVSVCGDCKMKPSNKADREGTDLLACYVTTGKGPRATWAATRKLRANLQGALNAIRRSKRTLRLGAFGDPAALPPPVVATMARAANYRITGYTHAWRKPYAAWLRPYVMASVESEEGKRLADSMGWRTFRVAPKGSPMFPGEIHCPAVAVKSRKVECNDCLLCDGMRQGRADKRKSIFIETHGIFK